MQRKTVVKFDLNTILLFKINKIIKTKYYSLIMLENSINIFYFYFLSIRINHLTLTMLFSI